jgi:hypothetical protein
MLMSRDHFIPAAFLGRFSCDDQQPSRSRRLSVMRPESLGPYRARAETIGFARDLYHVDFDTSSSDHGARFVDALWDEYEPRLATALDMVIENRCDLEHWINVLVPFVGSLLVRDRWYGARLAEAHRRDDPEHWSDGLDELVFGDVNMNLNRIAGRNLLMGRLLVSDWVVGETTEDLCTSDLGYTYLVDVVEYKDEMRERVSLAVPISKRSLLVIRPEPRVRVLTWDGRRWGRLLNRFVTDSISASDLNMAMALDAQDFIAGSAEAVGAVDPALLAKRSIHEVQQFQEYWPYRTASADLAGIWGPLRQALRGLPPSALATMELQPHVGLTDRLRNDVVIMDAPRPRRARVLQDVISADASGFLFEW